MELKVLTEDPLYILTATKKFLADARFVSLNEEGLGQLCRRVDERLSADPETDAGSFTADDYSRDAQRILLQSAVNFCFWAEKDQPKWQIEMPDGKSAGGNYGMVASFERALAQSSQILDAGYLAGIGENEVAKIFRSNNGTQIPLLSERAESLREAGGVLTQKYGGQFINALEEANFNAIAITQLLNEDFPSFRDVAKIEGRQIPFLKRAQICAYDLSPLAKSKNGKTISGLEDLTAFIDYKIPQMLENAGVIEYAPGLALKINDYDLIEPGSREEVGIRSAGVWGVELVRQRLEKYSAAEIDYALWFLSQDQTGLKPYHRTRTIYY